MKYDHHRGFQCFIDQNYGSIALFSRKVPRGRMGRCGKSTRAEILGLVNSETQDREDRQRETERERERERGGGSTNIRYRAARCARLTNPKRIRAGIRNSDGVNPEKQRGAPRRPAGDFICGLPATEGGNLISSRVCFHNYVRRGPRRASRPQFSSDAERNPLLPSPPLPSRSRPDPLLINIKIKPRTRTRMRACRRSG